MLTARQRELLDFLTDCQTRCYSPTFDEMAAHLGLASKSGIHRLITSLEKRKFIRREKYGWGKWARAGARSIEVIRSAYKDVCPHCKGTGHVDAAPVADRRVV